MKLKALVYGLGIIIIGLIIAVIWPKPAVPVVTSFEECAALYPVMESYPEQCNTPDGKHFVRDISSVAELGKQFTLNLKEKARFSGGFTVVLDRIEDSRCKQGVQCIWAGQLSPVLHLSREGVAEDVLTKEIFLGTETPKTVIYDIHSFTLINATETSATILVSLVKIDKPISNSEITGYVHVGPICPVERMPPDPNCADRPFANAVVTVLQETGTGFVGNGVTNSAGKFSVAVPAGKYRVSAKPVTASAMPSCQEAPVVAVAGKTTVIDIACDSGIR